MGMIGRWATRKDADEVVGPKGFDDYTLRLGDLMRGERATLGKSLLDVQRELRIKASYIAAIENCDPSAFDTQGFIAGYVRSYARYLGMDADDCFAAFCAESGFYPAHGMSAEASGVRRTSPRETARAAAGAGGRDPFTQPTTPFVPGAESLLSRIEPAAIGSMFVLLALIGGIGFGGWSVLREVQRVQVTPVDQTPVVLSDLDPLDAARAADSGTEIAAAPRADAEALDRLYRPQALDVPVLVARDAPISTLDPSSMGIYAQPRAPEEGGGAVALAVAEALGQPLPQVVQALGPGVTVLAARPAWVRVRSAEGTVLFEGVMDAGDHYAVPQMEVPPSIHIGEAGSVYFAVDGTTYGPAGSRGQVLRKVGLDVADLTRTYVAADIGGDLDLVRVLAELKGAPVVD